MADDDEVLDLLRKIHGLLELLAEDKVAQRDAKQRTALREIVGSSQAKKDATFLMDGSRTQADIRREISINQGYLSTMVGSLQKANLLLGDPKKPRIAISIPSSFFDNADRN